jgi:hypothetical protein
VSFLFEKLGKRERTAWEAVYYYYANLASDLRFREREDSSDRWGTHRTQNSHQRSCG